MSDDKTVKETPKEAAKSTVDPNTLSAPDQAEVQQLHSQRADAEANGDGETVKAIDVRLAELTRPKQ